MYIEPNTVIKLYKNVPLNNTYTDTLYFESRTKQNEYFHSTPSILVATLQRNSYQRVNKGRMRVSGRAENYYTVNYLAFQNSSFGSKWFYAFVTSVEYINNETVEIAFEIDVMQTYFLNGENGDVTLKQCFVEREHSSVDNIGSNIIGENFSLGEMKYSDYKEISIDSGMVELSKKLSDLCVIIAIGDVKDGIIPGVLGDRTVGSIYDNGYSGCQLIAVRYDDVEEINNILTQYIGKPEEIVGIYLCPVLAVKQSGVLARPFEQLALPNDTFNSQTRYSNVPHLTGTEDFDGYHPKNKKLYTYPYNYFNVDNGCGQTLPLRYEFFGENGKLKIDTTVVQPVQVTVRPINYKGVTEDTETESRNRVPLMTESISIGNYPNCNWIFDSASTWFRQNMVTNVANVSRSAIDVINAGATGEISGDMVDGIVNNINTWYKASLMSDVVRGDITNSNINVAHKLQTFYTSRVHINGQNARIIDDYFTMFGYKSNEVKKPNINVRAEWTYTKTVGCTVVGSAPSEDIKKICELFDRGIRFWITPGNVGNYSLNNEPL